MSFSPKGVRTRLTLWYVALLAGILAVYLASVFLILSWRMEGILKRLGAEDLETVKGLLYFEPDGHVGVREDYHHHTDWKQVQERLLEILAPDGAVLYQNERLGNRTLGGPVFAGEGVAGYSGRSSALSDGTPVVLISRVYELEGKQILIRVGYPRDLIRGEARQTLLVLILASPWILGGTAYAAYMMVGRTLKPVAEMARRAEQINSERLDARLPVDSEDELGQLAKIFNAMLARIEQSFEQLQRFTADASHELRTPLAAIRSTGEVALQKDATAEEYRDAIGSMLEEVNRLTAITESLLTLSRADAGQVKAQLSEFPLMPLVREAAALLGVLMDDKRLTLTIEGDEMVRVNADRLYIRQAIINILHNAVKFTPAGGSISVCVRSEDGWGEVLICDSGPGVSTEHASRIFDRFYRADESRTNEKAGAGLGLSVAKWAVEASGGKIGVLGWEKGATFWVRLPSPTRV